MAGAAATAAAVSGITTETHNAGVTIIRFFRNKKDLGKKLDDNWTRLIEEEEKLKAMRDDILAEAKKRRTMQINKKCQSWISRVGKREVLVEELQTMYTREKDKEKNKFKLRLFRRAAVSKKIADECEDLRGLYSEGEKFMTRILVERLPEAVKPMHAPNIKDKPSLYWAVEEILSHLRDNNVRRVGLWGMAGVGKTAIMQNLNNHEDIAKMFDIVIWITVSEDGNEEGVQRAIIERLKLNVEGITDSSEIGMQISDELESKKYLLLLDAACDSLKLPLIATILDNQKNGKVVLATRHHHNCFDMNVDRMVPLNRLSKDDAVKLFRETVGEDVLKIPGVEPVVQLVVRECAGLPLLIDRVGRCFRQKDHIFLWRDGLRNLRTWPSNKVYGMDELNKFLRYCYDHLDGEDKKECFRYNALFPADYEINKDYLLECWRAEGFIHDANGFRVAREKGHTILDHLLRVSLLEMAGDKMNHVRMNNVVRNMALHVSSEINIGNILVEAGKGLQESPNDADWQGPKRISLMDNQLCTLPEMPACNNLSTLLLQENCSLKVIPKSFFSFMQKLRVLDLHRTGITSLPSVSSLECLRALYLDYCTQLMELPFSLEELMKLEILDIRGTGINNVPIQIGCLRGLKCLRMSLSNLNAEQSRDVELHRNVLSKLHLLEELVLDLDPSARRWEADMKSIIEEVATLQHLNSLSICFPGVDYLKIFTSKSHSWNDTDFIFKFSVVYDHDSSSRYQILDLLKYQILKYFKYVNGAGADLAISAILTKAQAFELIRHKGVSKLSDFGVESLNEIRVCLIEGCDEIEMIVDGNSTTKCVLRSLETLLINNVPKLVSIWEGVIHAESLGWLTTLTLCKCPKLKKIFSNGMIEQLSKLQNLTIDDCAEIEEIIMEFENNRLELDALPSLKTLVLIDLPKVRSIWIDNSMKWSSLKTLKIFMCPLLTKLPFNNENALQLRRIECQNFWSTALEWPEDSIKQRLEELFVFIADRGSHR